MLGSLDGSSPRKVSSEIDSRAVLIDGYLLFVRDGVLLAQRFDPDTAQFTGEAKPLVDGLHYFRSTGNAAFAVSTTGLLAWRSARESSRLAWFDRQGTEVQLLEAGVFDEDVRLSPDGKRYAVGVVDAKQGASDVWIYDLARRSKERKTSQQLDEKAPVWGADGRTMYYRSDGGGGAPDIAQLLLAEERTVWTYRGPRVEEPQDVSKDGRWLLFVASTSSDADILVLPLNPPGPPKTFVATAFRELSPRFSPDGRRVAYQSDLSGRPEAYIKMFDGSSEPVRVSTDGGTRPRWRRDGKELFFLGLDGRLMAVDIAADGTPSAPHALFPAVGALDFDVAPDGSRFLMQVPERSEVPVHLLMNWRSRLRDAP
jgi:Tol biopolymer transport system component